MMYRLAANGIVRLALWFWVLACLRLPPVPAVDDAPTLRDLVVTATKAQGTEYAKQRAALLVPENTETTKALDQMAATDPDIDVRLMAAILAEARKGGGAVALPKFRYFLSSSDRIGLNGKNLARACDRSPLILAEELWKDTGRLSEFGPAHERPAYLIHALANVLKLPDARSVIAGFLSHENFRVREEAAWALQCFGKPDSLPALLARIDAEEDAGIVDSLKGAAHACMTRETIPLLDEFSKTAAQKALREWAANAAQACRAKWPAQDAEAGKKDSPR